MPDQRDTPAACCRPEADVTLDELSATLSSDPKLAVREAYGRVARQGSSCCGGISQVVQISERIGYSPEEMIQAPQGANLGLGCGNPVALASLREGETVLDLGSGAGFDCFLAARRVGEQGRVIGVDMTPEMVECARRNAEQGGYANVEFRLGEIENLPVADHSVDVVLSNCVINLSPDKPRVFQEAFRVLKPGGRLMISDLVLLAPLPEAVRESVEAYVGCMAGASLKEDYLAALRAAGFQQVEVVGEANYGCGTDPQQSAADPLAQQVLSDGRVSPQDLQAAAERVVSVQVAAVKPAK